MINEEQSYDRKKKKLPKIKKVHKSVSMPKIIVNSEKSREKSKEKSISRNKKKLKIKKINKSTQLQLNQESQLNSKLQSHSINNIHNSSIESVNDNRNNYYSSQIELERLEEKIKRLEKYVNQNNNKFFDFFNINTNNNNNAIKQNTVCDYNAVHNYLPEITNIKLRKCVPYDITKLFNDNSIKNYEIYALNEEMIQFKQDIIRRFQRFDKNMKLIQQAQRFMLRHPNSVEHYYYNNNYYDYDDY